MRAGLPFREAFTSVMAFSLALIAAAAPVATALFLNVMPYTHNSMFEHVVRGSAPPPLVIGSAACVKVNETAVLSNLKPFVNGESIVTLILAGVAAALTLGQSIEYRYFFLEVLDTGGRLKAFARRYFSVMLAAAFLACLASSTTAAILKLSSAFPSYWGALAFALWVNVLASIMGASLASLASALSRSVSGGALSIIGFAALVAMASGKLKALDAVVTPANMYFRGGLDSLVYVAVLTLINATLIARVVRLEY